MSEYELATKSPTAPEGACGLVPVGYAEKAMASLMQLHSEVLEEKERRVDLHRRLMEKEQAVAELKMYVKLLEEKLGQSAARPPAPAPVAEPRRFEPMESPAAAPPPPIPISRAAPRPPAVTRQAPFPMRATGTGQGRPQPDGWKAW